MNRSKDRTTRRNLTWLTIQMFARGFFAVWFRYRVRGLDNVPASGAALLLINHQSYLDPLLVPLWLRRPVCFLARDNLFRVPLIGSILRATYVIPIDRASPSKSSFRKCIDQLAAGYLLGIFPEGTRTRDGAVGPIRPGFLAILRHCRVPVIPVGIAGASEAMPRGAIWIRPRSVRVVIGPPIPEDELAGLADRTCERQLVETVRRHVAACHAEADQWRTGQG